MRNAVGTKSKHWQTEGGGIRMTGDETIWDVKNDWVIRKPNIKVKNIERTWNEWNKWSKEDVYNVWKFSKLGEKQ